MQVGAESSLFDGSWKNAYIYDYWKHGNINAIKEENGIEFNQLYDAYKMMNRNMQVRTTMVVQPSLDGVLHSLEH